MMLSLEETRGVTDIVYTFLVNIIAILEYLIESFVDIL